VRFKATTRTQVAEGRPNLEGARRDEGFSAGSNRRSCGNGGGIGTGRVRQQTGAVAVKAGISYLIGQ
jgi:hypothetical protein